MSHWNYENIGASATPANKRYIEKIFEYIGYAPEPDYAPDGDECSFYDPDVYCCKYSAYSSASGDINASFEKLNEEQLLYLLNALFPQTNVYVHAAEGNNTSDTWENHDIVYDTNDMTRYKHDSYTDYGGGGANGSKSSKARFVLKAPKAEYVNALIDVSTTDGNTELTALLLDLSEKLKNGLIVYENDPSDKREIGEEYDIKDDVEDDYYDYDEDDEDEEYVEDKIDQ